MKRFRTSLAAKTAAVLLALAVGAGGFWSTVFILYQWDTLWLGSGYYDSNDYYSDLYNRSSQVRELARLRLVGNPNLGPETTPADVAEGARRLWELVSPYKPVDYLCVRRELCAALPEGLPCPVLPIRLWLTYPWAAGPEPDAP